MGVENCYRPPVVSVSDPVEFYDGHDAQPRAAFVAKIDGRCLTLKVLSGGALRTYRECIHRDDPELTDVRVHIDRRIELSKAMWDLPIRERRLQARLDSIEADLRTIRNALSGGPDVNAVMRNVPDPKEVTAREMARKGHTKKEITAATGVHHKTAEKYIREERSEAA